MADKLIVVWAFDKDEDGNLIPAFEPKEVPTEARAISEAKGLASRHVGVIAWSRPANQQTGDYGESTILFRHGDVPDLE